MLLHSALVQHKELQQFKNSPLRHHRSVSHSPWAKGLGRRNPALMLGIALTITRATPTWISYINWFFHVSLLTNQQTNNYHEVHEINEIIVSYYSKSGFWPDQESKITFTIGPQIVWLNKGNIHIPLLYVEKNTSTVTSVSKYHVLKFLSSYYLIPNKNKTGNSHKHLLNFSFSLVRAAEPCLISLISDTESTSDAGESIRLSMKVPIPQTAILSLILSTWQVC